MFDFLKKKKKEEIVPENTSPNIFNPIETDLKMVGNQTTIVQIIALLSYIRNIINTSSEGEIKVSIGKNVNSNFFAFSVNNQEVADLKAKESIEIN